MRLIREDASQMSMSARHAPLLNVAVFNASTIWMSIRVFGSSKVPLTEAPDVGKGRKIEAGTVLETRIGAWKLKVGLVVVSLGGERSNLSVSIYYEERRSASVECGIRGHSERGMRRGSELRETNEPGCGAPGRRP